MSFVLLSVAGAGVTIINNNLIIFRIFSLFSFFLFSFLSLHFFFFPSGEVNIANSAMASLIFPWRGSTSLSLGKVGLANGWARIAQRQRGRAHQPSPLACHQDPATD